MKIPKKNPPTYQNKPTIYLNFIHKPKDLKIICIQKKSKYKKRIDLPWFKFVYCPERPNIKNKDCSGANI